MSVFKTLLFSVTFAFAGSSAALAATIHNLDEAAHRVRVDNGGEVKLITLEPGAMYRMNGGYMRAQVEGHGPVTIEGQNEYVIWEGGDLTIQRRVDMKRLNGD